MTAPRTTDDLAWEAMELIRRKNVKFSVRTGGQQYKCVFTPREEYERSRANSSSSTSSSASSIAESSTPERKGSKSSVH